jgi:2'-5' RNA ligase
VAGVRLTTRPSGSYAFSCASRDGGAGVAARQARPKEQAGSIAQTGSLAQARPKAQAGSLAGAGSLAQAGSAPKEGAGCAQSALLVPVPEAEPLVGRWRALHDPKAGSGVPAHITLVVPWLPPGEVKPEHLKELDEIVAAEEPFDYVLDQVRWFGERVLWLSPSPAEPFKALTARLAEHFGTPPWKGEFREVVPHLTVGLADGPACSPLGEAAEDLRAKLPLKARATEVLVMCGQGCHWEVSHRSPLGPG